MPQEIMKEKLIDRYDDFMYDHPMLHLALYALLGAFVGNIAGFIIGGLILRAML